MGGGKKKERQAAAETASREASERERQQAEGLRTQLQQRRDLVGKGLPEMLQASRTGAMNLRETGGFTPEEIEPIRTGYREFANTTAKELEPIKTGYTGFAETGGFAPGEKESFLRRSTAPVSAMYGRMGDELNRRLALQGGYMPGFTSSTARLARQGAQAGAEASLGANVELANQVRTGKLAGLGGLERVGAEVTRGRETGLAGQERLAEATQRGRLAGQDALDRYSQFGVAALSDIDTQELRNRLQSGQMSQADAQLLTALAAQDKSFFENIMQGISTIGGAAAGVVTGINTGRPK